MGNIQDIPPSVIASWPKPNYDDPIRRTWMPAFALVWQVASTILVWGRFWLRLRRLAGPFGYDDAFMLIAWMSSVTFTGCAWHMTTHLGVDRHTWDVRITLFSDAAMFAWILQVLMLVGSGATKASVLLFYRRLVVGTLARRWRLAIYFALVFHAIYLVTLTLAYFLICRPLEAYWKSYDFSYKAPHTCAPAGGLNPVIGVLSVISDVYAVVLPFIILHYYTLDVPKAQRIGLNIIFALGLLVAGAGVGRTYYLIKLGKTYDTSWVGFDLLVWTIIELQLGIICACAPSLRAFFRRYLSQRVRKSFLSSWTKKVTHTGTTDRTAVNSAQRYSQPASAAREKEPEAIDMQVLTTHPSASSSEDPERRESSYEGTGHSEWPIESAGPETPAHTHRSTLSGGYNCTEPIRWNSNGGRSSPWPLEQDISGAILKAQSVRSTL